MRARSFSFARNNATPLRLPAVKMREPAPGEQKHWESCFRLQSFDEDENQNWIWNHSTTGSNLLNRTSRHSELDKNSFSTFGYRYSLKRHLHHEFRTQSY
ncbi:MAG TPA: hypothetical protein DCR17_16275 [Verrucomicrobiales bacterium]|nr:hypothetical protein [Pedosphaera sp.]HAO68227.1 hypothetical protein [Verrucomicrobiales bacterium]HAQ99606.1 hypothetical protein [Verrucomicrobiales bacterium]HAW00812.1 hypothetical protein [Verrucomicrobiales bacterium]HBP54589.1 hypothetical protein [Verrucomicrobiales bacterium]